MTKQDTTIDWLIAGGSSGPIERVSGPELLDIKGNYCNYHDAGNRIVYTPALPGAPEVIYDNWMEILRSHGTTHIPFGPIGGTAYPGVGWENPDGYVDMKWFRGFVEKVLDTKASDGKGFRPIIFLGGDTFDQSRIDLWADLASALAGLHQYLIVVPGWELVPGQWSSYEYHLALEQMQKSFPSAYKAVHFQPGRWVGSSNPVEPDDPWQGGESEFYKLYGGEFVSVCFYQTPHGSELRACVCPNADQQFGHEDYCYLNRFEDGVARLGTGYHGWRVMKVCAFETVAWDVFHGGFAQFDATRIANEMKRVADKWNIKISFGNGLPS